MLLQRDMDPLCDSSHWHHQKPRTTCQSTGPTRYLHPITPDSPTMHIWKYHEISRIGHLLISKTWLQLRSTWALWLRLTAGKKHQISSRTSFVAEVCRSLLQCKNVEFLGGMIGGMPHRSVFRKSRVFKFAWFLQIQPMSQHVFFLWYYWEGQQWNKKTAICPQYLEQCCQRLKSIRTLIVPREIRVWLSMTYSVLIKYTVVLLYLIHPYLMLHYHIAQKLWSHGIVHLHF